MCSRATLASMNASTKGLNARREWQIAAEVDAV